MWLTYQDTYGGPPRIQKASSICFLPEMSRKNNNNNQRATASGKLFAWSAGCLSLLSQRLFLCCSNSLKMWNPLSESHFPEQIVSSWYHTRRALLDTSKWVLSHSATGFPAVPPGSWQTGHEGKSCSPPPAPSSWQLDAHIAPDREAAFNDPSKRVPRKLPSTLLKLSKLVSITPSAGSDFQNHNLCVWWGGGGKEAGLLSVLSLLPINAPKCIPKQNYSELSLGWLPQVLVL